MLQFILTDAKHDAKQFFIEQIQEDIKKNETVFYLVPDHIKFDAEINLLKHFGDTNVKGNLSIQVYSFSRLAWYFLKDTSALSKTPITKIGLSFLIRYLVELHKQELKLFRTQINKDSFIDYILQTFMEFRNSNMTPSDLFDLILTLPDGELKDKLSELYVLYKPFVNILKEKYVEQTQIYEELLTYLEQADISHIKVYLHGFDYFSATELAIVKQLLLKVKQVSISLPFVNDNIIQKTPLTEVSYQTYMKLTDFAKANRITILENKKLENQYQLPIHPNLEKLITYWENIYSNHIDHQLRENISNVLTIQSYTSKQAEINAIAKEISQLVSSGLYRYKDIQILMRQVEDYEDLIKPILKESHIPFFIDNADSMSNHSLFELLESLYLTQKRDFKYYDFMRLLKNPLIQFAQQDQLDLFENFILKEGFNTLKHYQNELFTDDSVDYTMIKDNILKIVVPYFEKIKQVKTMSNGAELLYYFLIQNQVDHSLLKLRETFIEQGQLQKAKEQEQVWQTFINLLDEFVEVLGDLPFDLDLFYKIILNNFKSAEYSLVPSSLDEVKISSIDGKRESLKKITFAIGLNDASFPKVYPDNSLLTSQEKEQLKLYLKSDKYLNLSATDRINIEPYIAYQLFSSSTDKLYLLNYITEEYKISPYVILINKAFVANSKMAIYGRLHQTMRLNLKNKYENKDIAITQKLSDYLTNTSKDYQYLLTSFNYTNVPESLNEQIVSQLYNTNHLYLSVSQLENYFKDAFSYFLTYGLRLNQRVYNEISAKDIGNIYHTVLDDLYTNLIKTKQSITDLSSQQLLTLTHDCIEQCFSKREFLRFNRSETMKFTKFLVTTTLLESVQQLATFSNLLNMNTVQTEMIFDHRQLSAIPIQQKNILLRGKIDRVDWINQDLLSVVDYKSSEKKFDLNSVYDGVSLQLLTYLYVMSKSIKDKSVLGAFYYHIHNKYIEQENIMIDKKVDNRFKGLMIQPKREIEHLSDVFHVDSKKFKSSSYMTVISDSELHLLFDFLKLKVKEAGENILKGNISLKPMKNEKFIASLTDYRSISLFDTTLQNNQYNYPTKSDDFMALITNRIKGESK